MNRDREYTAPFGLFFPRSALLLSHRDPEDGGGSGGSCLLLPLLDLRGTKNILTLMEPSTAFPHRGPGVERTQEPQSYTVPRIRVPGCCAACNCSAVALRFLEVPGRKIQVAGWTELAEIYRTEALGRRRGSRRRRKTGGGNLFYKTVFGGGGPRERV